MASKGKGTNQKKRVQVYLFQEKKVSMKNEFYIT